MVTQESLKQYVVNNPKKVAMKESSTYPGLYILKYKKSVFFKNAWDSFLEHCRGAVIDKDFNLIAYPFQKIYNFGIEERAPRIDPKTLVTAYQKINGFMVALTWYQDDILVSTTGSTDSDFVQLAKEMMLTHQSWHDWQVAVASAKGQTLMFECVHPKDPHIIPEIPGMYFIGSRTVEWNSTVSGFGVDAANKWESFAKGALNCFAPESYVLPLEELLAKTKACRHEGFVFYTKDQQSSKIKSPYYLTSKWVARNPRTNKLVDLKNDIKRNIDEEYHGLIDYIRLNIVEYTEMNEQERLVWVRQYFSNNESN